jgi:nucleoside-diphosphate-sugar epimerase
MRVAVTGATGFLGRYIVRHLAGAGHRLRCWYRPGSDRGGFDDVAAAVEWLPGELGDPTAVGHLVGGADALVHAAVQWQGPRNGGPKNQIDTRKIRALGMTFGGEALLRRTVQDLIDARRRSNQ